MIQYRDMTAGPVEVCRELCNKLMAHQAQHGTIHPEVLGAMTFDSRLKPSFEGAKEKFLLVAYDGETPVGYVFADAEVVSEEARNFLPPRWGLKEGLGFYPPDMPLPAKVGGLNNLYVLPEYRGQGVGKELMDRAMEWLRAVPGVEWLTVNVSNGNDAGPFYEKYGFRYTHDVAMGFIKTYALKV